MTFLRRRRFSTVCCPTPKSSRSPARAIGYVAEAIHRKSRPEPKPAKRALRESRGRQGGFLRHGKAKEWRVATKEARGCPRACGAILPPWPGYPLLGCSSALPNSVSPGNMKHNPKQSLVNPKPAKRAHRLWATQKPAKSFQLPLARRQSSGDNR